MTVFISYAHESDEFRAKVRELCVYLRANGVEIISDFDHEIVPPEDGWAIWMQHGIEDAQVVLVVCSSKYKARYEKRAPVSEGHGVTWEGAILTAGLYDSGMRNDRIYPILPDGMSHDVVPLTLKDWDNGHRFPSAQAKILQLIKVKTSTPDMAEVAAMPLMDLNSIDSLVDEGEKIIAQKLSLIVKKHPALFDNTDSRKNSDQVAVQLITGALTLIDIRAFVRAQIVQYRNGFQSELDALDYDLKSLVGHLIGLVWHRALAEESPLAKSDKSLIAVPSHQVFDYAELFRDLLSALSDARPALFQIENNRRTSLAIRLDNATRSESGALDANSHVAQAISSLQSLTSSLLLNSNNAENRGIQMRPGATADWNLAKAGVAQLIFALETLKVGQGIGAFCYESTIDKANQGQQRQSAISQEALAKGFVDIGLSPEQLRVLQTAKETKPELDILIGQTAALLDYITGVFKSKQK
jgi:TIR domain